MSAVTPPHPDASCSVYSLLVICAECPVRRACLEYALACEIECMGIWGASTTFERRRLLPIRNSSEWLLEESRRRAIEHAAETLEAGLPVRLKAWRRASRSNEERLANGVKPPRYPVGRAPAIVGGHI